MNRRDFFRRSATVAVGAAVAPLGFKTTSNTLSVNDARAVMYDALPLEMQVLSSPAMEQGLTNAGYKVNWIELARRMNEVAGWKSTEDIVDFA